MVIKFVFNVEVGAQLVDDVLHELVDFGFVIEVGAQFVDAALELGVDGLVDVVGVVGVGAVELEDGSASNS